MTEGVAAGGPAVVLLRTARAPFPQHGVLGAIRSLGRLGVGVLLAEPGPHGIAAASRFLRGWVPWDPAVDGVDGLVRIARRVGPAILLPTDDDAVTFVEANAAALDPGFVRPAPPPGLADRLMDKEALATLMDGSPLSTPRTASVETAQDVDAFLAPAGLPVVVKAGPGPRPPGVRSVRVARDRDEVLAMLRGRGALVLQEHVPGSPRTANLIFDAYFDREGRCRFWATGRKLAQHPPYAGTATHAITERTEDLARPLIDLLGGIGYVGPVDVDARWDERTGRYVVLDVNPRIGGTFRAFVAPDGLDVVRCAYLDLSGEEIPEATVPDGRTWILESHVFTSALPYRRDGWLTVGAWWRSLRHIDEGGLLAMDDPRPAVRAAGHVVRRGVGRLLDRDAGEGT